MKPKSTTRRLGEVRENRTGWAERAARADIARALELLDRAGDEPPREGDEIPALKPAP